jgi:AraC-like DNA-binding protein
MQKTEILADLIARRVAADGVHATPVHGLWLIRSEQPTEPILVLHSPAVCIIAQGAKQVMLADLTYEYDPAKYLVVSVDLPLTGHISDASPATPYLCFRLDLDAALLASLLVEVGAAVQPKGDPGRGIYLSTTTAELADAAIRLVQLLDTPRDIPFLAPLLRREIHYRLLTGEQGAAVRHIATAESKLHQVSRAIAWLKANYARPFSMEALAQEARMSPSALHQHFKAVTAMSPLQYQKQLRLQEARHLIVGHARDAASAAYEVGYESSTQFSREYSRLFGAPPARDAARLREAPAASLALP